MRAFEMIENVKDKHRWILVIDFYFEVLNKIFKSYFGVNKKLAA